MTILMILSVIFVMLIVAGAAVGGSVSTLG
jgi:hypothetical protein